MKLDETHLGLPVYSFGSPEQKYAVAINEEKAFEAAKMYITNSLFTFNSYLLAAHILSNPTSNQISSLEKIQEKCGDDCNDFLLGCIKDIDKFVENAINLDDGFASFLTSYNDVSLDYTDFLEQELNLICEEEEISEEDVVHFIIVRIE